MNNRDLQNHFNHTSYAVNKTTRHLFKFLRVHRNTIYFMDVVTKQEWRTTSYNNTTKRRKLVGKLATEAQVKRRYPEFFL